MNRPKCKCGKWEYWATEGERPCAWAHDGMLVRQGFCFSCNCRLHKNGTVTQMVEANDWEMLDKKAACLESQVKILAGRIADMTGTRMVPAKEQPDVSVDRWYRERGMLMDARSPLIWVHAYQEWCDRQEAAP